MDRERLVIRAQTLSVYEHELNYNSFAKVLDQREKSWSIFEKHMKTYESLIATENGKKDFGRFYRKV